MISKQTADVAVIGGGPAGAVTALLLARAGVDVLLFERSHYDTLRLGETLPPSVNPVLRELGLGERFLLLASLPSYETASVWGDTERADRSFLFSPHGHGWHVDRARFDQMLSNAAEEAGARVLRGRRATAAERVGTRLRIQADNEAVSVASVVDATGRVARIAKTLGAERAQLDRLVCAARVFATGADAGGDTFIEAAPDGWWYASPLPEGRRVIAFFTDAKHGVRARVATVAGWEATLAHSHHMRRLAQGAPEGAIHMVSCASHELRPAFGPDWIAVGDAALAVDPLSSGGVTFALRSAVAACEALIGRCPLAYQDFVARAALEYRQTRAEIYGWERRFLDHDFWNSRAA